MAALATGLEVRIFGLRKRPELNGLLVTLHELDESTGRWNVRLQDTTLAVRSTNLITAQGPDGYDSCEDHCLACVAKREGAANKKQRLMTPADFEGVNVDGFLVPEPPPAPPEWFEKGPHAAAAVAGSHQWLHRNGGNLQRQQQRVALAEEWDERRDQLDGFVATEKFDGIRAVWTPDGQYADGRGEPGFMGKSGLRISAPPPSLQALLPSEMALDGELWAGRGHFQLVSRLMSIGTDRVRNLVQARACGLDPKKQQAELRDMRWVHLKYMIFDAPNAGGGYLERLEKARRRIAEIPGAAARMQVVATEPCEDAATLGRLLTRVVEAKGEGLVLRKANAPWRRGECKERRDHLKAKRWYDAEAIVLDGHNDGRSSLWCLALNQRDVEEAGGVQPEFGITWNRKEAPPPPGSVISYHYRPFTSEDGVPGRGGILRVHGPMTCEPDCLACRQGAERWEAVSGR